MKFHEYEIVSGLSSMASPSSVSSSQTNPSTPLVSPTAPPTTAYFSPPQDTLTQSDNTLREYLTSGSAFSSVNVHNSEFYKSVLFHKLIPVL